ncbi:hypothetical protein K9L16_00280 [Candidatus Pacearchaeota archaeon]|nr:hypothetical protein [Candidatus Pacearchaeota archaeon]
MFSVLLKGLYDFVKPVKIEKVFEADKCPYGNFEDLQSTGLATEIYSETRIKYGRLTGLGEDIFKRDANFNNSLTKLRRILFNV